MIIRMKKHPGWLLVALSMLILLTVIIVVFWPRSVIFNYGGKTCFYQPTVMPTLFKSHSDNFRLEASQRISIGNLTLAAMDMCVIPINAPVAGMHKTDIYFATLPLIMRSYSIVVPERPVALLQVFDKPVSVSANFEIPLSDSDDVFTYVVDFGEDNLTTQCKSNKKKLTCDLSKLKLTQGRQYNLSIARFFNGKKIALIFEQNITTVTPVNIIETSIINNKIIFAKPKNLSIILSKEIKHADVLLASKKENDKTVATNVVINKNKITVSWDKNLNRNTTYLLKLYNVIATDGSGLDKDFNLLFTMSGGPRVSKISVGPYYVQAGTTAVLTFDQKLSLHNVKSSVIATNGAKVVGVNGKEVYVSFADVPTCTRVNISVSKNIKSIYGISGEHKWSYDTRTICHTVTTIGKSIQGRVINAHWFGGGSKTILYTGAIHGDEISTYYLMNKWIDALEAGYDEIPSGVRIVVVPSINPDGVALGTRTNARNVDLNRNFDTSDWKKNVTDVYNNPFPGGGGQFPLSEPESQAIADLVRKISPYAVLSYHSIGSVILSNPVARSSQLAHTYAAYSDYSYSKNSSGTFSYSISGTADDYYHQKVGTASIVVELGSHLYHQFESNHNAMWKMLQ